jgi:hypothetical protein
MGERKSEDCLTNCVSACPWFSGLQQRRHSQIRTRTALRPVRRYAGLFVRAKDPPVGPTCRAVCVTWGTSLTRNRPLLRPYRRPMPRVLWWSYGVLFKIPSKSGVWLLSRLTGQAWGRWRGCTHPSKVCRNRPGRRTCLLRTPPSARERELFIDNLLVRIHLIIVMILVDRPCAMGV